MSEVPLYGWPTLGCCGLSTDDLLTKPLLSPLCGWLDRSQMTLRVLRGEKMLYSGANPESHITEYTLVYEEKPPET